MRVPAWRRLSSSVSVTEMLEAATAFPSGDYRRWKELARLAEVDHREVVAEAVRLLESGDADRMILGAEMLDVHVPKQKKIRGSEQHAIVRALRNAVSPLHAPAVTAAALGIYAFLEGDDFVETGDQVLLSSAIVNPDPLVRRTAARLLATLEDLRAPISPSEPRLPQEVLRDLLEHDPDPKVRQEAADTMSLFQPPSALKDQCLDGIDEGGGVGGAAADLA